MGEALDVFWEFNNCYKTSNCYHYANGKNSFLSIVLQITFNSSPVRARFEVSYDNPLSNMYHAIINVMLDRYRIIIHRVRKESPKYLLYWAFFSYFKHHKLKQTFCHN